MRIYLAEMSKIDKLLKNFRYYLLLVIVSVVLFLPGIASIPIIDRDSPHFAEASRQMMINHDYWNIQFQNKPRHLKPPGIYWLQTLSVHFFSTPSSNAVWSYTLVSVLGAMISVLATFFIAKNSLVKRAAALAAALLAASPLLIMEAHLIVTDSTLLACVVLMQGSLWQIYTRRISSSGFVAATRCSHTQCMLRCSISHAPRQLLEIRRVYRSSKDETIKSSVREFFWGWPLLFWLTMAAGILFKGITPLIAGLTILAIGIMDRDFKWIKKTGLYWGIPLVIALTACWLVPLSLFSHSNFLFDMLSQDAVPKLIKGQQSHGMPFGFFLLLFPLIFWPCSLFLWQGIYYAKENITNPDVRFLIAWIVPTWLFFELIPTKLPEYVLPTFPAIALIIALAVAETPKIVLPTLWQLLAKIQYLIWVIITGILAGGILLLSYYFNKKLNFYSVTAGFILLLDVVFVLILIKNSQLFKACIVNIVAITGVSLLFLHFVVPSLQQVWISRKVSEVMQSKSIHLSEIHPLISIGYNEPSLVFMLGSKNVETSNILHIVNKLRSNKIKLVLVELKYYQKFLSLTRQSGIKFKLLSEINGFNYSKGKKVKLFLFQRVINGSSRHTK